jgi:hypothetical protein
MDKTKLKPRDLSDAAIAARRARMEQIAAEIASIPILDRRPVDEIIDDLNALDRHRRP